MEIILKFHIPIPYYKSQSRIFDLATSFLILVDFFTQSEKYIKIPKKCYHFGSFYCVGNFFLKVGYKTLAALEAVLVRSKKKNKQKIIRIFIYFLSLYKWFA